MSDQTISRRELFRKGGELGSLLALPVLLPGEVSAAVTGAAQTSGAGGMALRAGPDVYQSIGVRPLINARGTFTIISGSTMLPEVRAAMDAAAGIAHVVRPAVSEDGKEPAAFFAGFGLFIEGAPSLEEGFLDEILCVTQIARVSGQATARPHTEAW